MTERSYDQGLDTEDGRRKHEVRELELELELEPGLERRGLGEEARA